MADGVKDGTVHGSNRAVDIWVYENLLTVIEAEVYLLIGIGVVIMGLGSIALHAKLNKLFLGNGLNLGPALFVLAVPVVIVCLFPLPHFLWVVWTWTQTSWADGYTGWCVDSPYSKGYNSGFQQGRDQGHRMLSDAGSYATMTEVVEHLYWVSYRVSMTAVVAVLLAGTLYAIYHVFQCLKATVKHMRKAKHSSVTWLEPLLQPEHGTDSTSSESQSPHTYSAKILRSLFETEKFSDCDVTAGAKTWRLHRGTLSAASPVFDRMFSGGLAEAGTHKVRIGDAEEPDVEAFLEFIYTGSVGDGQRSAPSWGSLLRLADMYEVHSLAKVASAGLHDELNTDNIVETLQFLKKWRNNDIIGETYASVRSKAEASPEMSKVVMEFAFESLPEFASESLP